MQDFWIEIARYAQVVLGISLVIFVHEAGHFVCARLCKVKVEVFSLGMGPRVFGWRRGPTLYQVALIPIGGYVRMAGEESLESRAKPAPDELHAKSVGQRFLIYSGGVLANVVFGLVVFPIIFAAGVPCSEPVLGPSLPGSPAWRQGIPVGTRVLAVNGHKVFDFGHILTEVALGSPEETSLEVVEPGASSPSTIRVAPVWSEDPQAYTIGVAPSIDSKAAIRVEPGSAASAAGLETGDRLLRVVGAPEGLPLEEQLLFAMRDGKPVTAVFDHAGAEKTFEVSPRRSEEATQNPVLGIAPVTNRVLELRPTPVAAKSGLRKDDRILAIDGQPIVREFDFAHALESGRDTFRVRLDRQGQTVEYDLGPLAREETAALVGDVAITPDRDGTRIIVEPETSAARAGMRDGDRILSIDGVTMAVYQPILDAAKAAHDGRVLSIVLERREASVADPSYFTVNVSVAEMHPLLYGFGLQSAQYVYKTSGPAESISAGLAASWKFLEESWLTLKRILLGQVGAKNLGGIITIGVVSHTFASVGLAKLLFFLCMLSMNLAFLNVLPIPVFDGGHLLFLLIEKIKGSPVSERVLSYSQMVGIVLIVSLMVWVTYSDVMKWIVHR
jgi:regulator of sigma E protease